MKGAAKPKIRKVKRGTVLVRPGRQGSDVYLILDGVLRVEVDGASLAEYGPGRCSANARTSKDGTRTSTLVAVTDLPRGLGARRIPRPSNHSRSSPPDTAEKIRTRADRVRVTFLGVRGSTPAPGEEFLRYGGHTSCVAIAHDGEAPSLLLDAGTGIRRAELR